jgi:hypothetical protein
MSMNQAAFTKFEGYELMECGCAAASPCSTQCTAECANPSTLNQNSPCGQCLIGEAAKTTMSTCTLKAGETDCIGDPTCAPFLTCVLGC